MIRDVFITSRAVSRPLAHERTPAMLRADGSNVLVELHVDHERPAGRAQPLQQRRRRLRLALAARELVDDDRPRRRCSFGVSAARSAPRSTFFGSA